MDVLFRIAIGFSLLVGLSMVGGDLVRDQADRKPDLAMKSAGSSSSCQVAMNLALLISRDVQTELDLDVSQQLLIEECLASFREESDLVAALFVGAPAKEQSGNEFDDWISRQRMSQASALAKLSGQFEQILNPDQWSRLKQLQRQREGLRAFTRPDVVTTLQLRKEQIERIHDLPVVGFCSSGTIEHRSNALKNLSRVLTESQWLKWQALVGEEFTFDHCADCIDLFRGSKELRSLPEEAGEELCTSRPGGVADLTAILK